MPVKLIDNSDKFERLKLAKLETTMLNEAGAIMRLSQLKAPKLTGDLKQSHRVERMDKLRYQISANTPYARRRHYENQKNPSTTHYLEDAGDQITKTLESKIKDL